MHQTKVSFYRVKDNATKLDLICLMANKVIEDEKRLMISVTNPEAGRYVNTLLWRKPEASFIPHLLTQHSTQEWIAISMECKNINQAQRLLNLNTHAISFFGEFEELIELWDETSPEKKDLSQNRWDFYLSQNLIPQLF